MSAISIKISQRCPVSGRFYSNTRMNQCCYCASEMTGTVSRPQGKMTGSSNTYLKPVSTMGLSSCWIMWHIRPVITLSLDYAKRKRGIGTPVWLLICVEIFFASRSCCCQKSFIHAFTVTPWPGAVLYRSMWPGLHYGSWFALFLACYCQPCCLLLILRSYRFFETLC